jgi:hypothetical protein|tara:strand:+ start:3599 stop:4423 length:825 start_codon:yes stop_codon:yes gene_type:complete
MIGFNALGRMGRFANQMFQYASLKGIARKTGVDLCIPNHFQEVDDGIGNKLRTELFGAFDLKVNIGLLNNGHAPVVKERFFHFDEELFTMCPDHVSLIGYFQSEKYFKHIEDEIREDFTFKDEVLLPCKEMMESVDNPIALHIRRTDYLTNSENHFNLPLAYYEAALKHFDDDRNVIVFSDDPAWCSEQELFSDDRFMISENTDNRVDLCLMSLCSDFIIANSSYSWWGAWLSNNKNKKVIAPVQWFGKTGYTKNHDTKDLIPDDWTRIIDGQE